MSNSGLAAAASAGGNDDLCAQRIAGFAAGQKIEIDGETRSIARARDRGRADDDGVCAGIDGAVAHDSCGLDQPAGGEQRQGFEAGQKIGIDIGGNYEVATVTAVGKAATQTTLSAAAPAGATNIKLAADSNMSQLEIR